MNRPGWLRELRRETRGRFSWFRLRRQEAERPLQISTAAWAPAGTQSISLHPDPEAPVKWLLRADDNVVVRAIALSLQPVPERRHGQPVIAIGHPGIGNGNGNGNQIEPNRHQADSVASLVNRLRVLLAIPLEMILPGPDTVLDWPGTLMPFQVDGVRELIRRDRILLADDMGLGKTLQSVAAIRVLVVHRSIESALIVAPASLLDQWRGEISKWAPELRTIIIRGPAKDRAWQWTANVHITLISYETLLADFTDTRVSPPRRKVWDLVVLDEAQRIKNRNDTSNAVKQLRRKRSWALTGTPLENQLADLASILEFVDHGETTSNRHYAPGPGLLDRHRELQLRRKKIDVLAQLPPKQVSKLSISLLPEQRKSYDRAEAEGVIHLKQLGHTVRIQHVLELITRLKQVCNADPETGESSKLADVRERLAILANEGNRALIFSQYTDQTFGVEGIADAVKDFLPLRFTGEMSTAERDQVIQSFKNNHQHKALVLSLRAGGLGLNLQDASYVFHLDRWWNPAIERQAEDRSHRYGQVVPVHVFKYMCIGTIEERIDAILEQKQRLFDEVVDDVSVNIETHLTSEELFGLFGVEAPVRDDRVRGSSGLNLEDRCARILRDRGWGVELTPPSRDGGVDVIGRRTDELGIEETIYVQCKDHARPVGVSVVRELLGIIPAGGNVRPILATPEGVTADAAQLAKERGVMIWDKIKLSDLEIVP